MEMGGTPVSAFRYDKLRALLIFLVTERGTIFQRDWLAALFWPDFDEKSARQNLRRALANLRQLLNEDKAAPRILRGSRSTVMVTEAAPCWTDIGELAEPMPPCEATTCNREACLSAINRVEQRIALYRGEFLVGFNLPGCPEFDHWVEEKREAAHRRVVSLLEQIVRCHERTGRYAQAVGFAVRLTQLNPWDETSAIRVMRLHSMMGNVQAAIDEYERRRKLLRDDLGVAPSPAMDAVAEQLRRRSGSPSLGGERTTFGGGPLTSLTSLGADRRLVTVLCCRFTGRDGRTSEEMSDPFVVGQREMENCIRAANGYLISPYGGCIMAYFGYLTTTESAHVDAVGLALRLVDKVASRHGLEARVLLHSGWIVSREGAEYPDTVGETSDTARSLCSTAIPGQVLVSESTYRLITRSYACAPIKFGRLPGLEAVIPIFRVIGATSNLTVSGMKRFIGQKKEMDLMLES